MSTKNKWERQDAPPPPLFLGQKERDLVKQVNDEVLERVIGQTIIYYPIDQNITQFHNLYGEAIEKSYLPPIRVHAMVKYDNQTTTTTRYGIERLESISVGFHKRRLTEDQDLYVREGDFILHGELFYEITTLAEPKWLFGRTEHRFEISAKCRIAREGLFNGR
jgi:hypothetical protein